MRLLIDTHILIWWISDLDRLSQRLKDAMEDDEADIFVSVITPWEISINSGLGKLTFDPAFLADFDIRIRGLAFTPLAVTSAHGVRAGQLKGRNRDPFDRMLAAQALTEGLTFATADPHFVEFGVPLIWT